MASQRDKDYHKLRNPDKYGLTADVQWAMEDHNKIVPKVHTKEDAEALRRYEKIHQKYGCKSMVGDKRRRNTTRKSNQKDKQTFHQIRRAQERAETRTLIQLT